MYCYEYFVFDAFDKPETFVIFFINQYVSSDSIYFRVMHFCKRGKYVIRGSARIVACLMECWMKLLV